MSDPAAMPATVRQRLGARLLDSITLLWVLGFVLIEIDQRLLGGDPLGRQQFRIDLTEGRVLVFAVVVIFVYETVPTVLKGATLGKALFGLRVCSVDGDGWLPWTRATARSLVLYGAPIAFGAYGGLVLLVLLIAIVVPASGRGIHDRLAGSVVWAVGRGTDQ